MPQSTSLAVKCIGGIYIVFNAANEEVCRITNEFSTISTDVSKETLDAIADSFSGKAKFEIPPFELVNESKSNGFFVEARKSGDQGIYEELSIGVTHHGELVADVLVGIDPTGQLRLATSLNANPDHHQTTIYPMTQDGRAADESKNVLFPRFVDNWSNKPYGIVMETNQGLVSTDN